MILFDKLLYSLKIMEIFIHKFDRKDREAMRDMATESKLTIRGLYLYACKRLSTWFRYGEYLIKWDSAVWVLGLSKGLTYDQKNVRHGMHGCSIDFITELIIGKYGEDFDLAHELKSAQEAFTDMFVFHAGIMNEFDFNYKRLLKEPARYQRILHRKLAMEMFKERKRNRYLRDRDHFIYYNCHCRGIGCDKADSCLRTEIYHKAGDPKPAPFVTVIENVCIERNFKYHFGDRIKEGGENGK